MLIAKLTDSGIEVAEHQAMFPDTSFSTSGPNEEFMQQNNCMHVSMWLPYDSDTEILVGSSPYIKDGIVYTVAVQPKPIENELK